MSQTAEDIQRQYYASTAVNYDGMHLHEDDAHYISLRYISNLMEMLDISSLLDVGAGTGRGITYFLEQHPGMSVLGIEPVQELIEQAKKNGIPADSIIYGDGRSMTFADNSFDAVIELGILHHVQNPNLVVSEMIRVAKKVVFLSDSNRFGQGGFVAGLVKLTLYKLGLWTLADLIKTKGKGYTISEGDGLAYSYSVYDSYNILADWADRIILIPTSKASSNSWFHPLLTSSHVLVCAIKD